MGTTESSGDGYRKPSADTVAQLLDGGPIGAAVRESAHESGRPTEAVQPHDVRELHVCMGLNACEGHDADGNCERLPGAGSCATVQHDCHGGNQCRGQGGCGYLGREYEQTIPGEQSCSGNGSCASPINESRVHSAGPFKGTGVWKLARKRFEQRMWQSGKPFDPAPGEGYPDSLVPSYEKRVEDVLQPIYAAHKELTQQAETGERGTVSGIAPYEGGA